MDSWNFLFLFLFIFWVAIIYPLSKSEKKKQWIRLYFS